MVEGIFGHHDKIGKAQWEAELEWGEESYNSPLAGALGPLPSNLYILEDFALWDTQVLESPLVHLVLVIIDPS